MLTPPRIRQAVARVVPEAGSQNQPQEGALAPEPIVFQPAWEHVPERPPWEQRPPEPRLPRRYPNEKAAEAALERLLAPYFDLYPQVRLTQTGYPPQRIDYIATLPEGLSLPFFGVEVKRGFDDVKSACEAIRQAMRYRKARMADGRAELARFLGDLPPYVFLWPPFRFASDDLSWTERRQNPSLVRAEYLAAREGEARALSLFMAHFNIGHIVVTHWWNRDREDWSPGVTLMRGQEQVWTSRWFDGIENGFRFGAKHGAEASRGLRFFD